MNLKGSQKVVEYADVNISFICIRGEVQDICNSDRRVSVF